MFIDFVTYLEIRDDLPEEDKQYINSEIKKNMAKYHMEKDGIKYYVETKRPGVGLHMGVEFCISMQHKRYKKYIKRCEYNSYFEGAINVKDSILDYYNEVRIKWIPVNERYIRVGVLLIKRVHLLKLCWNQLRQSIKHMDIYCQD